jgi:hypothetical protein
MTQALLKNIYNAFDPFHPLDAVEDADLYVNLDEARGKTNVLRDLGRKIDRSDPSKSCVQIYAGHRGTGKSTELLRLKKYLEERDCYVVYFAADQEDIDPEDAQYTDVLIACTRRLLEDLQGADRHIFLPWLEARWQDLRELALTEIEFDSLKVDVPAIFAKLSTNIRAIPTERQKIRERLNPHTVTLLETLKQFITDVKKNLPDGKAQLVLIVDNLDRIVPVMREGGRTNQEEIFVDRAEQLKGLGCHVIYTVPISIAYSRANDFGNSYDNEPLVLPTMAIDRPQTKANQPQEPNPEGRAYLRDIIGRRVQRQVLRYQKDFGLDLSGFGLVPDVFEQEAVLAQLCRMSGGHMRDLLRLVRTAFDYVEALPITKQAAQWAIAVTKDTYRRTIATETEWQALVQVAQTKTIEASESDRALLFRSCILQYAWWVEADQDWQIWYDVHPLILSLREFRERQGRA